jgi:DNA primase
MITHETISNILSVTRIEEVISDFVSLRKRGVNFIGLCPFHNEKTPSFTVSPSKGIYKCFGCGKAGNAVNFVMEHEHFTYPEALRYLAKRYQITVEEEELTPEKIQEQNEREALFQLNQFAQQYFERILFETEEGRAVGLTYLKERGFREDTIRKFQLGYSPEKWAAFSSYAVDQGYKTESLLKSGLSIQKENRLVDRFHGRVLFPIHSTSGRIIGFGGRVLSGDRQVAKYINSPESDIYNKSRSLYGISLAKNAIAAKENCYLVEGYTDVISLYQAGIENAVASSGTSLTQEQVRLIRRYTPNITILYDGDPAGIKASLRGTDLVLEQGMNVRIVLFPEGEDPDSYARKNRGAEVERFITRNAVNFILFKTRLLLDETAGDPIRKATLVKEIVNTVSLIPDGITRSVYIRECAAMLAVPEQTLLNELNKLLRKKFSKRLSEEDRAVPAELAEPDETAPPQVEYDLDSSEYQEREIVRLLVLYGNEILTIEHPGEENETVAENVKVAEFIINDISRDEISFESPVCQQIFNEVSDLISKEIYPDREFFLHHPNANIATLSIDFHIAPYELSQNWERNNILVTVEKERLRDSVLSALFAFKAKKIEKMISENQRKLRSAASDAEIVPLMEEQIRLKEISRQINYELGRIIIK